MCTAFPSGTAVETSDRVVQVIVKLSTVPGQAAEAIRALRSVKLAIQSARGLICAHIYADAEAADSLMYVEEWHTPENLRQEAVAEHFKRLFALMERSAHCPILRVVSFTDSSGIEHLNSLIETSETAARRSDCPQHQHHAPTVQQPDGGLP